jgi:hypothetical protein
MSVSINERKSKVQLADFAPSPEPLPLSFLDRYPGILAARDLKEIVQHIIKAHKRHRPVIFTFGAHVIKCGLSRIICELIRDRVITAIATNGASVVHDVEIALFGHTSEDVEESIIAGTFGTTAETISFINTSLHNRVPDGCGYGKSIGIALNAHRAPNVYSSIFATGFRYSVPPCVAVAIGTDVTHMDLNAEGHIIGEGSLADFWTFTEAVADLADGGVIINFGSAVLMPEMIFKAIAYNRSRGVSYAGCVMVDCDMNRHYRPMTRIVGLANTLGGKGYHITSHHELLLPLLGGLLKGAIE